jgi:adenosylhomocysteine nucleosidase
VANPERPLGVICAMPEEIEHLSAPLAHRETETLGRYAFRQGELEGRNVVLIEGGVGKVSTATVAALLLGPLACRGIVLSGVAGGVDPALGIGDVVVAERILQHDYGAMVNSTLRPYRGGTLPLGEPQHPAYFTLDPGVREALGRALEGFALPALPAQAAGGTPRLPGIRFGTVVTGDQFINCEATRLRLFENFAAQAVEMEGGALAQVAERFGVPWVVVRSLSDLAGADSHLDIMAFLHATAASAASVVRRILPVL